MTVREPSLVSGTNTGGKPSPGTHPTSCPPPPMANPGPEPTMGSGGILAPRCTLKVTSDDL